MLQTIIALILVGVFLYAMFHSPGGGSHGGKGDRPDRKPPA